MASCGSQRTLKVTWTQISLPAVGAHGHVTVPQVIISQSRSAQWSHCESNSESLGSCRAGTVCLAGRGLVCKSESMSESMIRVRPWRRLRRQARSYVYLSLAATVTVTVRTDPGRRFDVAGRLSLRLKGVTSRCPSLQPAHEIRKNNAQISSSGYQARAWPSGEQYLSPLEACPQAAIRV